MKIKLSAEANFSSPTDVVAIVLAQKSSKSLPSALDGTLSSALNSVLKDEKFDGKAGKVVTFRPLGMLPSKWLLVVGGGDGGAGAVAG